MTPIDKTEMEPIKEESESPTPNSPTARKVEQTDTSITAPKVEHPASSRTVDSSSTAESSRTVVKADNLDKQSPNDAQTTTETLSSDSGGGGWVRGDKT